MQPKIPRILLVEDHEDTCELFLLALGQENYQIATSPSVSGAMALAKNQKFDLIVLDFRLTDGSGIDLCRSIRMTDQSTPILFYSGRAYESDKQEAFHAGAQCYLVKPVEVSLLCKTVARMIADSPRATAALARHLVTRKDSGDLPPPSISA